LGVRFVDLHRDLSVTVQRQSLAAELKTMIESGLAAGAAKLSS
jgi:hypothetical protein